MKNALLLLLSASALSLASCSQEKTSDTTTTTTAPAEGAATTTTTVSDATYKTRGTRMADKFATDMKITDQATKEKLRTAYYNRSKRYDALKAKYQADTAGYAAALRDYNNATDQEFQTILVVPAQYSSYQSSRSNYDESNNLDTTDQTDAASSATMPSDSSNSGSAMSSSTTTTSTTTTEETPSSMSGAGVAKGKSKLTDGTKVKVKTDGTVKVKDAAGNKAKM